MAKIVINVHSKEDLDCKYQIVRDVAEQFSWEVRESEDVDGADVVWHDCSIPADRLASLKGYQKVNHFPGMSGIFRKNCMANNLNRFRKMFPKDYNFYPKTWILPGDLQNFKAYVKHRKHTFIVKPEASSQGQGIYLVRQISDIKETAHCVAQRYIEEPLLIDGLKFDLRIYVLVTGCDPLRIFIHEEGLARFATQEYEPPNRKNIKDSFVHLTNYSINKNNPNFVQAAPGKKSHKRSLSSVLIVITMQQLSEEGVDVEGIWDNICDIVVKTVLTIQPTLASTYRSCQPYDYANNMCFEILGFDIILDSNFKPWLLEVNHSPSFSTDSDLDTQIKTAVITEALVLVDITENTRKEFIAQTRKINRHRSLSKKCLKLSKEERESKRSEEREKRDRFEDSHAQGFIKLYPGCNDRYYEQFLRAADSQFNKLTGLKRIMTSTKIQEDEEGGLMHF
jgi:tubulin polyglutamylase TTLL6/13